jgi:hypothetical protein
VAATGPIQPVERFGLNYGRLVRSIARMRNRRAVLSLLAVAIAAGGCKGRFGGPSKDEVTAELRKEAETFKQKGEQSDPVLRLKSTWNIEGVDVVEQDNENRPYRGTIRFKIVTTMRDPDGTETNDRLDKQFNYEYDVREKRWLILYTPAPPVRR